MAFFGESVLTNDRAGRAACAAAFLKTLVLCFMLLAAPAVNAAGSAAGLETDSIKPLQVGDQLPERLLKEALQVVSPVASKTQFLQLEEFAKGSLILDFWATWCKPCIRSLGDLDSLQQVFGEDLTILPVTYQKSVEAKAFFIKQGWKLPSLVEDRVLHEYFPHEVIPHQVWIRDNKVAAITYSHSATEENFHKLIDGSELALISADKAHDFDQNEPLWLDGNGRQSTDLLVSSVITGHLRAKVGRMRSANATSFRAINSSVPGLIVQAFPEINLSRNRILWQISDSLKRELHGEGYLRPKTPEEEQVYFNWAARHVYCYELNFEQPVGREEVTRRMRAELVPLFERRHGVRFELDTLPRETLVLRRLEGKPLPLSKGGKRKLKLDDQAEEYILSNQSVFSLYALLGKAYDLTFFEDESGLDEHRIDLQLPSSVKDNPEELNRQLRRYGMELVKETRPQSVLIANEVPVPEPNKNK